LGGRVREGDGKREWRVNLLPTPEFIFEGASGLMGRDLFIFLQLVPSYLEFTKLNPSSLSIIFLFPSLLSLTPEHRISIAVCINSVRP
jgi:hypothetical protein